MSKHLSLEEYRQLEPVQFPIKVTNGQINSIDLVSDCCDHTIVGVRVITQELVPGTIQLIVGGHCGSCGKYESGKLRWYLSQERILDFREDQTVNLNLSPKGPVNKAKSLCLNIGSAAKSLFGG